MDRALLTALARDYGIPAPAMRGLAATVAARCALIANRYDAAPVASDVGAQIGAAILAEFEPGPDAQAALGSNAERLPMRAGN